MANQETEIKPGNIPHTEVPYAVFDVDRSQMSWHERAYESVRESDRLRDTILMLGYVARLAAPIGHTVSDHWGTEIMDELNHLREQPSVSTHIHRDSLDNRWLRSSTPEMADQEIPDAIEVSYTPEAAGTYHIPLENTVTLTPSASSEKPQSHN